MKSNGWRYYNHAVVPTTAPHEEVDLTLIKDGSVWKTGGIQYLLVEPQILTAGMRLNGGT